MKGGSSFIELESTNGLTLPGSLTPDVMSNRSDHSLSKHVPYSLEMEEVPQGRHLGVFSTIILFISRIVGSGIFATSSGIYVDVGGSPFLFFTVWFVAATLAFSGLYVFLELGSLTPRSGGMKVFLEFIYDKPYMFASVVFLLYSIMFGFTILNTIIFGEYVLHAINIQPTDFKVKAIGLAAVYFVTLIHGVNVHAGVKVQNILGGLKLILLFFMILTGFYLFFFLQKINHITPQLSWSTFFVTKLEVTSSKFASAVIKASFSYAGWNSVHTVSSEIRDPVRTFKLAGPLSLLVVSIAYFSINFAYLYNLTYEEISESNNLVGSLLFEKIFGVTFGRKILTFSVALCSGSNIFVVLYTVSRVSFEAFREGFFPFSKMMVSTWPFGTPLPTLLLSCLLTTLIMFTPSGDIYNYIIDLEGYPVQIFTALCAIGVFILRRKHPDVIAPIRSSLVGTFLILLITLYLVISPLCTAQSPNPAGLEHWPSYPIVAIGCLFICVSYWLFMFRILPFVFGYELVCNEIKLGNGLVVREWVKEYT